MILCEFLNTMIHFLCPDNYFERHRNTFFFKYVFFKIFQSSYKTANCLLIKGYQQIYSKVHRLKDFIRSSCVNILKGGPHKDLIRNIFR